MANMAHQSSTLASVSVFGPLLARGMAVWSAEADAWPGYDLPEDVVPLPVVPTLLRDLPTAEQVARLRAIPIVWPSEVE